MSKQSVEEYEWIMPDQPIQKKNWNIFARELEIILAQYKLSLSQLDDRAGIPREKVRRLLLSLETPKMFPILNPSEMELLRGRVGLEAWDQLHLRAAMLATSIEKILMERMPPNEALLAAEQIFPIIHGALQKQSRVLRGSGNHRGGDNGPSGDNETTKFFDTIWDIIDEAEMEIQLSFNMNAEHSRIASVHSAFAHFADGHARLVAAAKHIQNFQIWHDCKAACQQGMATANKCLKELGEKPYRQL